MSKTAWLELWRDCRKSINPDLGYENKLWLAINMAKIIRSGKYLQKY